MCLNTSRNHGNAATLPDRDLTFKSSGLTQDISFSSKAFEGEWSIIISLFIR